MFLMKGTLLPRNTSLTHMLSPSIRCLVVMVCSSSWNSTLMFLVTSWQASVVFSAPGTGTEWWH